MFPKRFFFFFCEKKENKKNWRFAKSRESVASRERRPGKKKTAVVYRRDRDACDYFAIVLSTGIVRFTAIIFVSRVLNAICTVSAEDTTKWNDCSVHDTSRFRVSSNARIPAAAAGACETLGGKKNKRFSVKGQPRRADARVLRFTPHWWTRTHVREIIGMSLKKQNRKNCRKKKSL